jgi:uncharacterized protein (TIGR02271 family)
MGYCVPSAGTTQWQNEVPPADPRKEQHCETTAVRNSGINVSIGNAYLELVARASAGDEPAFADQRGAVTLRKEVVSERQHVEVPVTREELVIERHATDGREPSSAAFEHGKEIRVPLSEERVRVEKRPVVREEVVVGKLAVHGTKNVTDDIKHEELKIENEGDVSIDSRPEKKRA